MKIQAPSTSSLTR